MKEASSDEIRASAGGGDFEDAGEGEAEGVEDVGGGWDAGAEVVEEKGDGRSGNAVGDEVFRGCNGCVGLVCRREIVSTLVEEGKI